MRPIIISAIIATGLHVILMAFMPSFITQSNKLSHPETKSVLVAISYRQPEIKKISIKPDNSEKEIPKINKINKINKIKEEPKPVRTIPFKPVKKTRVSIKKKKSGELPEKVKQNSPVIHNQQTPKLDNPVIQDQPKSKPPVIQDQKEIIKKKLDIVKEGEAKSIKTIKKNNISDQPRTLEKTTPQKKEIIKPKDIVKPKEPRIEFATPLYKKNTLPAYPVSARKRGYHGLVELMVLVSEKGTVSAIKIFKSSKYKSLDRQAINTVKTWLFEPGKKNGTPEKTWVKIPVKFELN